VWPDFYACIPRRFRYCLLAGASACSGSPCSPGSYLTAGNAGQRIRKHSKPFASGRMTRTWGCMHALACARARVAVPQVARTSRCARQHSTNAHTARVHTANSRVGDVSRLSGSLGCAERARARPEALFWGQGPRGRRTRSARRAPPDPSPLPQARPSKRGPQGWARSRTLSGEGKLTAEKVSLRAMR
jgi:hypothetical protein